MRKLHKALLALILLILTLVVATALVSVVSALTPPTLSVSPFFVVTQGGTLLFSSSGPIGGLPPYTYQWFSEPPGVPLGNNGTGNNETSVLPYSAISGATSANYAFVTSSSTTLGGWYFLLQVTDSAGESVNSSAFFIIVSAPSSSPTTTPQSSPASTSTEAPTQATTQLPAPTSYPLLTSNSSETSNATVADNSATVDESSATGVSVTVSGSSLQNGTIVNVTSVYYGVAQPQRTGTLSINNAFEVFYDVKVASNSGAIDSGVSAAVSISNPYLISSSSSVIMYWNGGGWVSVATTFTGPDRVSGSIPASVLNGTPIAVSVSGTMPEFPEQLIVILLVVSTASATILIANSKKKMVSKSNRLPL